MRQNLPQISLFIFLTIFSNIVSARPDLHANHRPNTEGIRDNIDSNEIKSHALENKEFINDYKPTALHEAAISGNEKAINDLIKKGVSVNSKDSLGSPVLNRVVFVGNKKMLKHLVEEGKADVNAKDKNGNTALHQSIVVGDVDIAQYLLTHGAKINAQNNDGHTALHFAVMQRKNRLIQFLVNQGAKINIKDKKGKTPLDIAKRNTPPSDSVIKLLESKL